MDILDSMGAYLAGLPVALQILLMTLVGAISLVYKAKVLRWPLLVRWPFAILYGILQGLSTVIGRVLHGKKIKEQWLLYDDGPRGPIPLRLNQKLPAGAVRRLAKWEVDQYAEAGKVPSYVGSSAYSVDYYNKMQQESNEYWNSQDEGYNPDMWTGLNRNSLIIRA